MKIRTPGPATHLSANVKKRVKQILSIVLGRRRPGSLPRTLARARVNNVTHVAWTELRRSGASRVPLAPAVALRFPATSVATLFYRCARGFREAGGSAARSGPRARGRSPGRERSPAGDRAMPRVTIVAPGAVPLAIDPARAARPARSCPAARHNLSLRRAESGRRSEGGPVRARTRASAAPRPPIANDRARRPTDPRGYRRAGPVGRRARAAVTRAPPLARHAQPRSETIAPSHPAIH